MNDLPRVTIDQVMAWEPCGYDGKDNGTNYTRERVERLFDGREAVNTLDILDLDIDAADRIWAAAHKDVTPGVVLHEVACQWAEHVLHFFEEVYPDDRRPRQAIETKRRWIRGEATDDVLAAARTAARTAAWSTDDVLAAARTAAWSAARAAARAASRYAVWAAAWSAAGDAEREWQVTALRNILDQWAKAKRQEVGG